MDPPSDVSVTLMSILEKLTSVRGVTEQRVGELKDHNTEVQEKAVLEAEKVSALFSDIRRQLDDLEKKVLDEISRKKEQLSLSVSDLLQKLEIKNDDLSRRICDIEELLTRNDPAAAAWIGEEGKDDEVADDDVVGHLDDGHILVTLHQGLAEILSAARSRLYVSEMTLDTRTAAQNVAVLGDLKTAITAEIDQHRPESPERFAKSQVLSQESFSWGRHYWEVELSTCGVWYVGVSYASMQKEGLKSSLGNNDKSWCVCLFYKDYTAHYDSQTIHLPLQSSSLTTLGIYLDYEAGKLSFYQLGGPIIHLHTFSASFTEPLHAAFALCRNSWVKIRN